MSRVGQILVAAILVREGYDETMGESVVQLLGAGIPAPFEILDEWQAGAQIAAGPHNVRQRGRWCGGVELEKHHTPINTALRYQESLLIFCWIHPFIHIRKGSERKKVATTKV